jgi:hypothetical protein
MITPQKLLLSIAATAAGFALILSSVMLSAAATTGATGAEAAPGDRSHAAVIYSHSPVSGPVAACHLRFQHFHPQSAGVGATGQVPAQWVCQFRDGRGTLPHCHEQVGCL